MLPLSRELRLSVGTVSCVLFCVRFSCVNSRSPSEQALSYLKLVAHGRNFRRKPNVLGVHSIFLPQGQSPVQSRRLTFGLCFRCIFELVFGPRCVRWRLELSHTLERKGWHWRDHTSSSSTHELWTTSSGSSSSEGRYIPPDTRRRLRCDASGDLGEGGHKRLAGIPCRSTYEVIEHSGSTRRTGTGLQREFNMVGFKGVSTLFSQYRDMSSFACE